MPELLPATQIYPTKSILNVSPTQLLLTQTPQNTCSHFLTTQQEGNRIEGKSAWKGTAVLTTAAKISFTNVTKILQKYMAM